MKPNVFIKGIVSDIDHNLVSNDQWVFPTSNIRIVNDGQVYKVMNVLGNELLFSLPVYYVPLAWCSYMDIIFILSYSTLTKDVELGSYPSFINRISKKLDPSYHPFYNLSINNVVGPFRTALTGFDINSAICMFAREDYDDTINLYICDGHTSNKIINTGFTIEGYKLDRVYKEEEFPYSLTQFKGVKDYPIVEDVSIENGGTLKPGNYYIYLRYLTAAYDSTHFVIESGPWQVYSGSTHVSIEGLEDRHGSTMKRMVVQLQNLDKTYKYYQVGICRWTGEMFSAYPDIYIIDQYYDINDDVLVIDGSETTLPAGLADLMAGMLSEDSCESHTQNGNIYWGANWNQYGYDKRKLAELALKVMPYWDLKKIPDYKKLGYEIPNDNIPLGQHKDYHVTYEGRTFYRGEAYPVAIVFVLEGRETEAFPITGIDYYDWTEGSKNTIGVVCMPDYNNNKPIPNTPNDLHYALGLKLLFHDLNNSIDSDPTLKNVINGYYVVIGDRIINRVHNGITVNGSQGAQTATLVYYAGESSNATPKSKDDCRYYPYWGFVPSRVYLEKDTTDYYYTALYKLINNNIFCMYSPNLLFNLNSVVGENMYFTLIGDLVASSPPISDSANLSPGIYCYEYDVLNNIFGDTLEASTVIVPPRTYAAKNRFSSYYSDPLYATTDYGFDYAIYIFNRIANRSIKSPAYIGIRVEQDNIPGLIYYTAVGLYRDHLEYKTVFENINVTTQVYHRASELLNTENTITLYKGDCFLQRVFFRQARWSHKRTDDTNDTNNIMYQHGVLISFLCESNINSAMRNDTSHESLEISDIYTYFPKCQLHGMDVIQWTAKSEADKSMEEAFDVSPGYNTVHGVKSSIGYDSISPDSILKKKTRVRHSAQHVPYSFFDGYRLIKENEYVDYELDKGAIHSIQEVGGNLVIVQENAISQLYSNEKQIRVPTTEGELMLGTESLLAKQSRRLADFGANSQHAVINIGAKLYGIDVYRGKIWVVGQETSQYGSTYLSCIPLSDTMFVTSEVKNFINEARLQTEAGMPLWNPYKSGVKLGYDKQYEEILFSFNSKNGIERTFVFNDKYGIFIGTYDFASPFIASNEKMLVTSKFQKVYRHNILEESMFYGQGVIPVLSWIVNTMGEQELSTGRKFESIYLEMSYHEPSKLIYRTPYQHTEHATFIDGTAFWRDPVYNHNRWIIPIENNQEPEEAQYLVGSEIHGGWLKVTTEFKPGRFSVQRVLTHMTVAGEWTL